MPTEKTNKYSTDVPTVVRDFIFDLHDATRRALCLEDVRRLYETRYRELTEQFYNNAHWPEASLVASECNGDELFLALYREMTFRNPTVRQKPSLADQINSYENYRKLFELVVNNADELCVSTQWIYDITQEFGYQFQGFCQYRSQHAHESDEAARVLQENRGAWSYAEVVAILNRVIRAGKSQPVQAGERLSVLQQFGYFASIELARVECLVGDHSASLAAIAHLRLQDRKELFASMPICFFNVFYHLGVSNMMLKRFDEALDVLSEIILHVIRMLKPGATASLRPGVESFLRRMVDRVMGLAALLITIKPTHRIEDQVKEAVEAKFGDKMKRLQSGDRTSATEIFEAHAPKFVTPSVAEFGSGVSYHMLAFHNHSNLLVSEIMQHVPFLKLRSLLTLYSSIDISKLSRFLEMSDADLICALLSFKNKQLQSVADSKSSKPVQDVHFYVDGGVLMIDNSPIVPDLNVASQRYFAAGVKKHYEIMNHLGKTFKRLHDVNQEKTKTK